MRLLRPFCRSRRGAALLEFTAALVLIGFLVLMGSQGLWTSYLIGSRINTLAWPASIAGGIVYLGRLAELTPPSGVTIGTNAVAFTTTTGWGAGAKNISFNLGLQGSDLIVTDSAGSSKYLMGGVVGLNGTLDGKMLKLQIRGTSWKAEWAFPLRP